MASRLLRYLRGDSEPQLPDQAPPAPAAPKTCLQRFTTAAYFAYTVALMVSLAFYILDEFDTAAWIVAAVASLHFVLGGLLSMEGSVSIRKRYEWEDAEGNARASGFRGGVTILSDFIIMPAALTAAVLTLTVDDGNETHLLYGVALTSALVGNLICNLLHITD